LGSYSHPDPRGNSSTASASIGFRDSGTGSTISVAGDFNGLAVARPLRTWDMTASSCVTCCVALSAEFSVQSFVPQVAERGVPFVRMEIETFRSEGACHHWNRAENQPFLCLGNMGRQPLLAT
jgi:hypothetical protein